MVPLVVGLLVVTLLAGCVTPDATRESPARTEAAKAWPYPTGTEWPSGLVGPFELEKVIGLPLARPDGVQIFGSVLLPKVPAGVRVPTILEMGPYFDVEDRPTGSTTKASSQEPSKPLDWVKEGYAVAYYSVRGTGRSSGCFEMGGLREQADASATVEFLAAQPWSNGRVGMMGLSYPGTTPIEAGIHNPKGLAAVAVIGTIVDWQLFYESPQHEPLLASSVFGAYYASRVSLRPAPLDVDLPLRQAQRVCPEVLDVLQGGTGLWYSDERDTKFWKDRRYRDQVPDMSAALFLQQGFNDAYGSGHIFQDRTLWTLHPGPKRMFEGQWGHQTPPQANIERAYPDDNYTTLTMHWFDYWLKGVGTAADAGVGRVEFEDTAERWHRSSAFPPAEAVDTRLFIQDRAKLTNATSAPSTLAWRALAGHGPGDSPCTPPLGGSLALVTDPMDQDVIIAGNPSLELRVASDKPNGALDATLYVVRDDAGDGCGAGAWTPVAWGWANLRFWQGDGVGRDFPTNTSTQVHIDLSDLAAHVPAGARLGLGIAGFDVIMRPPRDYPNYRFDLGAETYLEVPILADGSDR